MMKRRISIILLTISLTFATLLGGCDGKGAESTATLTKESSVISTETVEESVTQESSQEASTEEPTEESKTEEPKEPFVADRSAVFELLSNIKIGWNLGNTLDAHGAGGSIVSETYWGNPKTTQEMIDVLAAKGFNAIRIPVTFAEHVGKAPDYTILEPWLNRVQEIVDYAINADMYVVLDTHHEPDYWLIPNSDHEKAALAELSAIWKQVAERFKDYDDKLIFEGMNEPRVKGSAAEWNGGSANERKIVDKLNQAFVDAVRSTGGNNETRLLVICTYGNNPGYNIVKELAIPEDNNIAVAVHMYTPYYFTYAGTGGSFFDTWDGSQTASISSTVKQLEKYFIKKDVPVIVTEFGAVNKGNSEEVIKWAKDYLTVMNNYGIKCFWWDNGCYNTTGENFGLLKRKDLTWYDEALVDALVEMGAAGTTGK